MKRVIGIRREDKNEWERRVPLIPADVEQVTKEHKIEFVVQPSPIRIFTDDEYRRAGATINEDLSACSAVFAVKEIPSELFQTEKTYIFFSHTIKGQEHNMPMLKTMMEQKCSLIDYEKVTDDKGRRLIFFGNFAGYAGMIDTLWALGQRLAWEGMPNPFEAMNHTYMYNNLTKAEQAVKEVGQKIERDGLPAEISPLIIGLTGYGNVSKAAQEIINILPVIEIAPDQIEEVFTNRKEDRRHVYKVIFKEQDMVKPKEASVQFELQDYYTHPEKYESSMEAYLPYLGVLVNCIYWEARYPRVLTKAYLKEMFADGKTPVLKVVGDISCDIEGAIECTIDSTKPNKPTFVYDPFTEQITPGIAGKGMVVMAVDNLPCELSRESSTAFSHTLRDFVPALLDADFTQPFDQCGLPETLKRAVILYHGELTKDYAYLQEFVKKL
ncbi:aminoadipic semialdehyde synthase [Candidatus Vecturithrix granuli]|uniref:Aminoadipic semialdehyde synthase n=1 Tax=Vecturithrix granuli TaxID=1499967 RepID=A0A0S6W9S2_VECG1|nr:aminoadipic semialdehyde synthase [Candidatus Vecturithrix granuli]